MFKGILKSSILLTSLAFSGTSLAVTMMIGDVDGFGFSTPNDYENAQNGLPDTNNNGIIEPGEFLPDLDDDGSVHITRHDEFDNRSGAEMAATNGAQWTDISLEHNYKDLGYAPSNNASFTFTFSAPTLGDADYGVDHYINFVFGDYDVSPATLNIDGEVVALTKQAGNQDGLVQLAFATIDWADMMDGMVTIDLIAPNEPYMAVDYALLSTKVGSAPIPIPEPSSLILLSLGLFGFGALRKRCSN